MKVTSIIENDIANSKTGINVSVWFAGCPHKCKGCHNQELWDASKYEDIDNKTIINNVINFLTSENIKKGLSILGGEPLSPENRKDVAELIKSVREKFNNSIKIYCWTGYIKENLEKENDENIIYIFKNIDFLIDGPFIEEKRQILPLRGSINQRVLEKEKGDF